VTSRGDRPAQPDERRARSPLRKSPTLVDQIDHRIFHALYRRSLVYNTCWEDPAVDREALRLRDDDTLLVITSAGCNVLDYALAGPRLIYAVDANPRQTALLELKLAGIRSLDFDDFFALFGRGRHERIHELYHDVLRRELDGFTRDYWDRHYRWFGEPDPRETFFFHGLSGLVARTFRAYFHLRPQLGRGVRALFEARTLDEQRGLYENHVAPLLWRPAVNWTLSRQITMSLLGVPGPQRFEVKAQHSEGVAGFIRDAVRYIACELPLSENYFWSVYVFGSYHPGRCPEYLKRENFLRLKAGLGGRVRTHTCTVTEFLEGAGEPISKFVLLDHMDWMSSYYPEALVAEWNALLERAAPGARVIFRSAHAAPRYLDEILVGRRPVRLREHLTFHDDLAARLTARDRVHTYAGFHIADVRPALA
jgi:S-adenosylmethionine-diacylglycerol 3-amino-3-carboxypropyl transferase